MILGPLTLGPFSIEWFHEGRYRPVHVCRYHSSRKVFAIWIGERIRLGWNR